ncbi:MAG: ABC transporter substrate-binding protein [Clostridia bacterium]|nr:ABC transporter substrate-binding protein [Clostridia bacterium]
MFNHSIFHSILCIAFILALVLCTLGSAFAEALRVAVVQPLSHTSLNQIRDTIVSELEGSDVEFEIVTRNAEGDSAALSTILENVKSDGVDILVPIATNTAQSAKMVFEDTGVPVVFAAVSDPVAAGLTGDDCGFITGVSNNIPAAEIVNLISDFQPDYKLIGFLYTSSETNSVSTINAAKAYCDANGIAYEEVSIANLSELQTAVETLISKGVDALYTGNDNSIASAMSTYIDVAYEYGIPVYCGADSMVADGGFATIGVDYVQLGGQVASIVERIANGEQPEDIPYETLADYARFVNLQAAERIGIEVSDDILAAYKVLVEADGTSHFGE